MDCQRCGGLMVIEECPDVHIQGGQFIFHDFRCLLCGEIVDPVIVENRRRSPDSYVQGTTGRPPVFPRGMKGKAGAAFECRPNAMP